MSHANNVVPAAAFPVDELQRHRSHRRGAVARWLAGSATCLSRGRATALVAWALLAALAANGGRAADSPEPAAKETVKIEDDTPEAAIRTFYRALAKGDARIAGQMLVRPKEMAEWVEIQAKQSVAFQRLGTAAVARFGEEGKALVIPVPAEVAVQKLETVKPVVKGDGAEWPVNPQAPMKMKRVEGRWRLDLYSSFQTPEHLRQLN
jgi:hypothetical protein